MRSVETRQARPRSPTPIRLRLIWWFTVPLQSGSFRQTSYIKQGTCPDRAMPVPLDIFYAAVNRLISISSFVNKSQSVIHFNYINHKLYDPGGLDLAIFSCLLINCYLIGLPVRRRFHQSASQGRIQDFSRRISCAI